MATKEQIKRIYALGAAAGLLDSSLGTEDNLHLWVRQFSLKEHISELTEKQAAFIIERLLDYKKHAVPEVVQEKITQEQISFCFKLMYRIAAISPSEADVRERLRGVVAKELHRDILPDRDIFYNVSRAEGSSIIELLKRILRSEEAKRKRGDKHGTGTTGKKEPP